MRITHLQAVAIWNNDVFCVEGARAEAFLVDGAFV